MKQVIHIFRKDVRHLWREIAASLALVGAYVWCEPATWVQVATTRSSIVELLTPLLPISWWLLVVRAVQDESLVGDRQFWVTRPYQWKQLLAANLLFVAAFVNLPLLSADVMLLWIGGFPHNSASTHGLLGMQLLWTLFVLLPTTALAAVTASVGQREARCSGPGSRIRGEECGAVFTGGTGLDSVPLCSAESCVYGDHSFVGNDLPWPDGGDDAGRGCSGALLGSREFRAG